MDISILHLSRCVVWHRHEFLGPAWVFLLHYVECHSVVASSALLWCSPGAGCGGLGTSDGRPWPYEGSLDAASLALAVDDSEANI